MPAPTLDDFVESLPTVLSREEAFAAFDTLLQRAEADTDDSTEMARALTEVLFHFSDSYSSLDAGREDRLRRWIEAHWRTEPVQAFGALFNLLANMPSPEVTELLVTKRAAETKPEILALIDRCLASRAAAAERNRREEEGQAANKAAEEARAERENAALKAADAQQTLDNAADEERAARQAAREAEDETDESAGAETAANA